MRSLIGLTPNKACCSWSSRIVLSITCTDSVTNARFPKLGKS